MSIKVNEYAFRGDNSVISIVLLIQIEVNY